MLRKNISGQFVHIQGVSASTGGILTGATWTMRRCLDGTFAAGGATITEDSTNGWYKVALTQADTNGNDIGYNFTATGAIPQTINDTTTACDPTTATNFGITSLPTTAVTTNASLLTSGTGTAQLSVSSGQVILQAGTGTGQLDFTSGVVKANLVQILGTALTETAGQIAAAFKQFFNIASPTSTMNVITAVTTTTTATTATNLTNAPTNGDFTATMKTSIGTAVAASAVASVTGNVGGNVTGSVGSVVGAVGSVTGNVGGNVVGSVASVTAGVTVTTNNDKTGYALTSGNNNTIAGLVWDVTLSSHLTAGSTGFALNAAGSAGDPWSTAIPGAYGAGTAGFIVGNNLDAAVSSRAAAASFTFTVPGYADANIRYVNSVAVTGAGTSGSPWGP